jgi:hypothetical protein
MLAIRMDISKTPKRLNQDPTIKRTSSKMIKRVSITLVPLLIKHPDTKTTLNGMKGAKVARAEELEVDAVNSLRTTTREFLSRLIDKMDISNHDDRTSIWGLLNFSRMSVTEPRTSKTKDDSSMVLAEDRKQTSAIRGEMFSGDLTSGDPRKLPSLMS